MYLPVLNEILSFAIGQNKTDKKKNTDCKNFMTIKFTNEQSVSNITEVRIMAKELGRDIDCRELPDLLEIP